MITQIEIDGFKTFKDFKVELAPFQVIVGPNGSGKSNLFDALHLLSRLADNDLTLAFQELRGEVGELFTTLPDGESTNQMRLAIEMLVNRKIRGVGEARQGEGTESIEKILSSRDISLQYTRLRYELEITLGTDTYGLERLYLTHESLKSIPKEEDRWCQRHKLSSQNNWLPEPEKNQKVFIDTKLTPVAIVETITDKQTRVVDQPMIFLYPDNDQQEKTRRFYANEVQQTVISRVTDIEHPHILAVQDELRLLRFFHLNTESLRQPGPTIGSHFLSSEGKNLPRMLARMQAEDKFSLTSVSLDMANLVPGILNIRVEQDKLSDKYIVFAEASDGRLFSSRVLSDGTLRLLALATIKNDPQFQGTLCLEEPENGVHPQCLKNLARLLRRMTTNFNDPDEVDEPLRQVLITTHSPAFISLPEVIDSLLFAYTMTRVEPLGSGDPTLEVTYMTPVVTPGTQAQFSIDLHKDETMEVYTLDEVLRYIDSEDLDEARKQFKKARTTLNEA
ncbi:MAG TPA: AAA family ATPase [Ktedonobacteraceae bacterium]|nr:AAA family ATPase [Ktedonobacteraceae bacterium]